MSENHQAGAQQQSGLWKGLACWVAVTLTLSVCAAHTSVTSQWHDDVGLIRALGAWPLGGQGVISTWLAQLTLLLPLGNRVLRAGLAANWGGALACWLYFCLLHRVLTINAHTPRLTIWLSMLGSLMLSLSQPMQGEASAAGGASLALALLLAGLVVQGRISEGDAAPVMQSSHVLLGGLVVAAAFEKWWAGVLVCVLIGVEHVFTRSSPRFRARAVTLGALLAAGACSVPLIRMLRPHRVIPELPMLGESLGWLEPSAVHLRWGGIRWWTDASALLLGAALIGAIWAAAKPRLRAISASWLSVLLLASMIGATSSSTLREDPTSVLRLAAFASVVLFATIAAQTVALLLLRSRAAYVGGAVFAIPALYGLLLAVNADEADIHAEAARRSGNDAYTQEAVWTLPRNSVLLLRSHELAHRIWAERLGHGMRPDLLVLTPGQLQRAGRFNRLLAAEPALTPLIRDWVLRGRPSEYVLSQLADVRPVFLELDNTLDARVREHLSAWGLWLEYHSQSLGRSDRYAKMSTTRPAVERVIDACKGSVPPDNATLQLVAIHLKEQLLVSAGLADRPVVYPLLDQLEKTGAEPTFVKAVRNRLDQKQSGPLDLSALQTL